jgi:hypothetical protein
MKWLRRWLSPVRTKSTLAPVGPKFRPRLEALEDRNLMNVSSVFDSAGNLVQFVVVQGGGLYRYDSNSGTLLADSGVRVVHAFRDPFGQVGLDVVYSSGQAFEYDSTGGHFMGTNILNMSRAYDAAGNFKLDVIYTASSPPFGSDLTGTLVEYTNTSVTTLASNVRWVSNYVDVNGGLGIAVGIISGGGNLVAYRQDTTGSFLLYNSPDGATQDLTDYSQAEGLNGELLVGVTFGRFAGTYSILYTPGGGYTLGDGTSIQVGG